MTLSVATAIVIPAFNILAYFALREGISARWLALCLILIIAIRFGKTIVRHIPIALVLGCMAVVGILAWTCGRISLMYYPVAVNAAFLCVFATSLWFPPTFVERIARIHYPDLDGRGVAYTRRVTQVWCAFFIVNGGIALATAIIGNTAVWAFYNGFLAYVLMGLMFAGEWLVRRRVMAGNRQC